MIRGTLAFLLLLAALLATLLIVSASVQASMPATPSSVLLPSRPQDSSSDRFSNPYDEWYAKRGAAYLVNHPDAIQFGVLDGRSSSESRIALAGVDLHYLLTIDNPASGKARVTLAVSDVTADTFEVREHGYHGLYVNVLSLAAYDVNGLPLTVQHLPDSGPGSFGKKADVWRIQSDGLSEFHIEYTVQPGLIESDEHRGYVGRDFAALAGEYVFLVPYGVSANTIRVAFDLPAGWSAYTPWSIEGKEYNPAIPSVDQIDSLSVSVFALGQFDVFSETVGTTEVAVAAYANWPEDLKRDLARRSWQILAYQTEVFGSSVGEHYLAIFCPEAPNEKSVFVGEWSTSQGYSIRHKQDGTYWGRWDVFAHQTFHRWNGWAWSMGGYRSWFGEGPNQFYEGKTVTELRYQRPWGDMEDELRWYAQEYQQDYVQTGKDRPLYSDRDQLDTFLIYRKGALASFLLAKEIYLRTDGSRNFDDFLRALFQEYGHHQALCDEECLIDELNALTGTDFTAFFDDYIYGTVPLPMDWAFEDDDGDGLSNALEIGWDTHPKDTDTDDDGFSDAREVSVGTDPLDPSSVPHFSYLPYVARDYGEPALPIRIDGEGEDWEQFAPAATDPRDDTKGGLHTDMKAAYVEVGPYSAYVMVEAYDPPLLSDATVELNLDLVTADGRTWELHTNINSDGRFYALTDLDGDGEWEEYSVPGAEVGWGNVMELRLLLPQLGRPKQARFTSANFWCNVGGEWTWVDMIKP
jgi:hypothetical protein